MKLQHNKPDETYGEEMQDRPCRFYWAVKKKGVLETNHGPVLCRDFLGDTLVWKAKEVSVSSIYGWRYTGPVETKHTSLVIDNFGNIIENVKNILNPIEKEMGVKLTKVEKTEDGDHVWVVGDKFWMLTTVHFSWYTTLLRYMTYNETFKEFDDLKKYPTNHWMDQAFPTFKKLPLVLKDLKVTQVAGVTLPCGDQYTMHDYNGWYSNTCHHKGKWTAYGEQLKALLA